MLIMQRYLKSAAIVVCVGLAFGGMDPALAQKSKRAKSGTGTPASGTKTLYDRLGGMQGIEELSDHFIALLFTPMIGTVTGGTGVSDTTGVTGRTNGTMGANGRNGTNGTMRDGPAGRNGTAGTIESADRTGTTSSPGTTGMEGTGNDARIRDTGVSRDTMSGDRTGTAGSPGMGTGTTGTREMIGTTGTETDRRIDGTGGSATTGTADRMDRMAETDDQRRATIDRERDAAGVTVETDATPVDPQSLVRTHVATRICIVAGGSCTPPATGLSATAGRLGIASDQWAYALNSFRSTLDGRNVPKSDQEELMTALTAVMHEAVGPEGMRPVGNTDRGATVTDTDMNRDRDTTGTRRTR